MTVAVNQYGGWTQTHVHKKGRGSDLGVLGQLIYSLHPFLILISCPSVSCMKRSQPAPSSPRPLFLKAISSPVTTTPYPLSSPPPLCIPLFSALCSADLTPLLWAFWHQPARGEVRTTGLQVTQRSAKEIWPQSNGRSHPLCALAHLDNDSKQLRPNITSEILLPVKLSPIMGIFMLNLRFKDCVPVWQKVKEVVWCLKFILDPWINSVFCSLCHDVRRKLFHKTGRR